MGLPPFENNTIAYQIAPRTNHIPIIEISTPKWHDHFDFKRANNKASQARSMQSLPFQRNICVLF